MSTSAILPISSIDFGSTTATTSQQTVFTNLLSQLQQAIGAGDLTTTQTLLNAIDALSPSSASSSSPLGTFLASLGTALNDGSVTEAQSALATYQSATPASTTAATTSTSAAAAQTAAQIAASLVESQTQLNLVSTLLGPNSSFGTDSSAASSSSSTSGSSASSLIDLLNAAYGNSDSSSTGSTDSIASTGSAYSASSTGGSTSSTSATTAGSTSLTPYDTLVSSIQASLAAGEGTITPALAYLQASGNFVNTSA